MITVDSVRPVDDNYGGNTGTPIARFYINRYMREIAPQIRGRVLEFGRPTYAQFCDCTCEVIDIDRQNAGADIHADVCDASEISQYGNRYDFVICTAVLQLVSNPVAAVANLRHMLKPGGRLILAEKAISRLDPWVPEIDRWRFTQHGIRSLMEEFCDLQLTHFGNVYAACAYLYGLPAEDIDLEKLDEADSMHTIITIANGKK